MWTYRALPATCRLVTKSHVLKYSKTLNEEKKKIWPCREWHCPPVTNRCTYVSPGNTRMWHLNWLEPSWTTSRTFSSLQQCCFSVLWRLLDSTSTSQLSLRLPLFLIRWQAVACMVVFFHISGSQAWAFITMAPVREQVPVSEPCPGAERRVHACQSKSLKYWRLSSLMPLRSSLHPEQSPKEAYKVSEVEV